jgi:hypothetical protein
MLQSLRRCALGVLALLAILLPAPALSQVTKHELFPHPAAWFTLVQLGQVSGVTYYRWNPQNTISAAGTTEDVWSGSQDALSTGTVFLPTSAAVNTRISSSSAGDTQAMSISGLDANGNPVTFTATLAGLTFVDTGVPLLRLTAARLTSGTTNAGRVFIHIDTTDGVVDGIPDAPTTELLGVIHVGEQGFTPGAFTCPSAHTCFLYDVGWTPISTAAAATCEGRLMLRESTSTGPFTKVLGWFMPPASTTSAAVINSATPQAIRVPALQDAKFQGISTAVACAYFAHANVLMFRN